MKEKLIKLAKLIVDFGVNIQKDQVLLLHSDVECAPLARLVTEAAYKKGAKRVIVKYIDEYQTRLDYKYASIDVLTKIQDYTIDEYKYYMDIKAARVLIKSSYPGLMSDIDSNKMQKAIIAFNTAISFYREFVTNNNVQWNIIAVPNILWAKKVFPNVEENKAYELLWDAILKASRINEDPIKDWKKNNKKLSFYKEKLNESKFKKMHFINNQGTDLVVGLIKNHIWAGGTEKTIDGIMFAPNIPFEEVFTMPDKYEVNGKVVSTRPLEWQGKLIEDFYLVFKNGKVIEYDAKKEKETLGNILKVDEGSSYAGEIALISADSPISRSKILFYNTLFDENASCHLALGKAYPMNVLDGDKMKKEELENINSNYSLIHVDFMFGSDDMEIYGIKEDDSKIKIFSNGNFVI